MGTYIIRRLLIMIPTLIATSAILFFILKLAPGDPLGNFAASDAITPEVRENIRKAYGLDDPIPVQYAKWATSWVGGNWGSSLVVAKGVPVRDLVASRLGTTLFMIGLAYLLALAIAVPIGILAAVKQYSLFDQLASLIAYFGFSVPTFFSGLVVLLIFAVKLRWFPMLYRNTDSAGNALGLLQQLRYAALPIMVLGFFQAARLMRYTRASMLENIKLDYVRTARAKGLRERAVVLQHVVRNALIPVVTIIALDLPVVFSGAIVTETLFLVPGMGQLLINAIGASDTPVVMAIVFLNAILVVLFNLIADVLYGVLDPRIKYS